MNRNLTDKVLDIFDLTDDQRTAAAARGRNVAVSAGAGSGKTRTLVARYISLLAEGFTPRRVAAITFTDKAALEMKSRVRTKLLEMQAQAEDPAELEMWAGQSARMDSARISTIHSLCSEILRAHPAEAGIDPRFEMVDEGLAGVLQNQAVEDAIKTMVEDEKYQPLLEAVSTTGLKDLLGFLLQRRLEALETFRKDNDTGQIILAELAVRMAAPELGGVIRELAAIPADRLRDDAGDKLAEQIVMLLQEWSAAEAALENRNAGDCAQHLFTARRECMKLNIGTSGYVKDALKAIREAYCELLDPLIGGEGTADKCPTSEAEVLFRQVSTVLRDAFQLVHGVYLELLAARNALDFNDLEERARKLLVENETIRQRWQGEIDGLLVDEFQDTNGRQRQIVEALAGTEPGRLFIVGDMRQSIYRFRRADVTVFKDVQEQIERTGGLNIPLDITYRTHDPLLQVMGNLLAGVIGTIPDETRKYYVPFTPMRASRTLPPEHIAGPYLEMVFGVGEDSETARPQAARALVKRLLEMKDCGEIKKWDEVALLFRASTGFPPYEEALEDAGIPFVTVAGRGFYDRPEIRDLLNIMRALADPLDDAAFAGLLRSPAFGLSDAGLFLLHRTGLPFWQALQQRADVLDSTDREQAMRVKRTVMALQPFVDRIPVGALLKRIIDEVDYRAILATADLDTGKSRAIKAGSRLWRNVDKLLEDAAATGEVSVRNFMDMLAALNDTGAREGEAPAEADGSVCLMTIHKSKGLEYPVVVLADANRERVISGEQLYLSPEYGAVLKLDPPALIYRLASALDADQEECERLRLLYVALTRAKDKLIISGHITQTEAGRAGISGWVKDLVKVAGLDAKAVLEFTGKINPVILQPGLVIGVTCESGAIHLSRFQDSPADRSTDVDNESKPLYSPIIEPTEVTEEENAEKEKRRQRLSDGLAKAVSGEVLGLMVHKALQHWQLPGSRNLEHLLYTEACNLGLSTAELRAEAVTRATALLGRLQAHPLGEEIGQSTERHHELGYSIVIGGRTENGIIDLLYSTPQGWKLLDFKTDPVHSLSQRDSLLEVYKPQVRRYCRAVRELLGYEVHGSLCFLDDHGNITLYEVA